MISPPCSGDPTPTQGTVQEMMTPPAPYASFSGLPYLQVMLYRFYSRFFTEARRSFGKKKLYPSPVPSGFPPVIFLSVPA